jgi:non-heme chloroperoxidase
MMRIKFIYAALLLVSSAFVAALSQPPNNTTSVERAQGESTTPIRSAFFTTSDGARIHYLVAGQMSNEPAIVFIPGLTLSASFWEAQLHKFSSTRLTIAVDSRSQGESSVMLSGNTPERRAIDLRELTADLHISRFVVVGWSQGAQDVAAYIQQFGTNSLAAIAFVDTAVSYGPDEIKAHPEFSKIILSTLASFDTNPGHYEARIHSVFRKPHPELDMQYLIHEAEKTPPSIETAMLAMDIFGADRRPALKKINRPTLVIASAESPLLDEEKQMATAIAGARWVAVQGAGHALFVDDPEKFDEELTHLLQAVSH